MVNDVETILNEIRERVRREEDARAPVALSLEQNQLPVAEPPLNGEPLAANLDLISAHLTTTARAWDRLPPVQSDRSGSAARLELWIKAKFRAAARWFTWEQVNFNAATHHALLETVVALSRLQQQQLAAAQSSNARLAEAEQRLNSLIEVQANNLQRHAADLSAYQTRISADQETYRTAIEGQFKDMVAATEQLSRLISQLTAETRAGREDLAREINSRLPELAAQIDSRLRDASAEIDKRLEAIKSDLHEEQRVSFKQLSLEVGEAAVREDRGRRALEARLEKLEQAEPKKSAATDKI
jgi:hypothetical protein